MSFFSARKTWKNGPFRSTISASGLSSSVGGKSGRLYTNGKRVRATARIPGKGISWTRSRKIG